MDEHRITFSAVITLISAYLGLFVGLIDANAVNLALPAVRAEFGGDISGAQWIVGAFNIMFAAVLLTSGSLGDRFGRRAVLRLGLVAFVGASLACAAAPTLPLLLSARILQGLGAGLMLPQGLAIAAAAFPGGAGRARATAAWAVAAAASTALGPLFGGLLTDTLGWRYVFGVNALTGLLALVLTYRHLPESRTPDAGVVDLPGQLCSILGLATLTIVLVEGRVMAPAWTSALAVVAAVCIGTFGWLQHRADNPMLPLALLRNRRLIATLIATFAMTFGAYGMMMVNSFAFQQQRGESALSTAVVFLPMPITYLALIPTVNALVHRTGPRLPMTTGLGLMAAGLLLYAAVGPDAELWLLEASFLLTGAGLAFMTGPAVALAILEMPSARAGLASGIVNFARLAGITVGVAALGTVMALEGVRGALLVGGVVELIAAAVVSRWVVARHARAIEMKEACHA